MILESSDRLVECVPNISEGRDSAIINSVADAVKNTPGVKLLYVDSNKDANRTVFTFTGSPDSVLEGAFNLTRISTSLIDMREQNGVHVRNGAVDVCPFIPVNNVTMDECVKIAHRFAQMAGDKLGIPSYLYGNAANIKQRRKLSFLRRGGYEALQNKLNSELWAPDYGPDVFNDVVAKSGTIQVGARFFMVAYNIQLKTDSINDAKQIARKIRTSGFKKNKTPGMFKELMADGWYMDSYNCAQVTMNLTDYRVTGLHHVYEAVKKEARAKGFDVNGSELIGLIPLDAIVDAGRYYLKHNFKGELSSQIEDEKLIDIAVDNLGLSAIEPFKREKRIFEFLLGD